MPEERALHVLGLVVDLRVERDVVAAGAGLVAARRVRGEADAGAEIFGECLLFFVAEADAREHHDAVSTKMFSNARINAKEARMRSLDRKSTRLNSSH